MSRNLPFGLIGGLAPSRLSRSHGVPPGQAALMMRAGEIANPSRRAALAGMLGLLGLHFSGRALGQETIARHGIAMHGEPALPPHFTHLPYADPAAPKGGRLTIGVVGSFDSLHPYIVRGQSAGEVQTYVFEPLLIRSLDEPFTLYGHVAQSVEMPDDRSSITFTLNPAARFSDGVAISAETVAFSLDILKRLGWPNLRNYYSKVERVEILGPRRVRLSFPAAQDRELPLILSLLPMLPQHRLDDTRFDQTTLEAPVGSGPYIVGDVDVGKSVVYSKNPDWWARDLPFTKGLHNFSEIKIEYFRDDNTMFEALKKGIIDLRPEDNPTRWQTGYDFPAAREGRVIRESFTSGLPKPMFALAFNQRRDVFARREVRQALTALFDFEWINANLFSNTYRRTHSYFEGSELSAIGVSASAGEKRLLEPFMDKMPAAVLGGTWRAPVSDGSGFDRTRVREALDLLAGAGYLPKDGKLRDRQGQALTFEAMVNLHEHERLLLAWRRVLDRVGIDLRIRVIDSAQFERRRQNYDYDMIPWAWGASLSPGNEQAFRWGSKVADQPGSFNLAGVKDPAVDQMVLALLAARQREDFVDAARALDRALIAGAYVLPLYHLPERRIAHASSLGHPQKTALFGPTFESWWRKPASP